VKAILDMPAGYSGTPLSQKLGIKEGMTVAVIGSPPNYGQLLGSVSRSIKLSARAVKGASFVHVFVTRRGELEKNLRALRERVAETGVVWISWPKKTAGVPTDVTEGVIRDVALPLGFVDVKVCAVDEKWSGLKLMIRRELRKKTNKQ
jgi:hypothetical protein